MNSFKCILSGFFLTMITTISYGQQSLSISGAINDEKGIGIPFATIVLKSAMDISNQNF